jgi:hypothetical protein
MTPTLATLKCTASWNVLTKSSKVQRNNPLLLLICAHGPEMNFG